MIIALNIIAALACVFCVLGGLFLVHSVIEIVDDEKEFQACVKSSLQESSTGTSSGSISSPSDSRAA